MIHLKALGLMLTWVLTTLALLAAVALIVWVVCIHPWLLPITAMVLALAYAYSEAMREVRTNEKLRGATTWEAPEATS